MSRTRAYSFTINNYTYDDFARLLWLSDHSRYLVIGFEKVKTEHMQCYVYFKNACRICTLKKFIPRAHIEISKGTPQQNYDYCTKDGDFIEFGKLPIKGSITMEKLDEVMLHPKENIQLFTQYRKVYNEIKRSDREISSPRLYLLSNENRIKFVKTIKKSCCFDIDTYDNEDVLFLPAYHTFDIELWSNCIPPKFKRGYEILNYDPKIIVILWGDIVELNYAKKKYNDYIDKCLSEEDIDAVELGAEEDEDPFVELIEEENYGDVDPILYHGN